LTRTKCDDLKISYLTSVYNYGKYKIFGYWTMNQSNSDSYIAL